MENADIGLFILALVAIIGTLINLFERRDNKPAKPTMKSQATKVQRHE